MYIYTSVSASGFPFLNENFLIWILGLTDWNCVKLAGNRVPNIVPSTISCLNDLFSHLFGHMNNSNHLKGTSLQALRWLLDHINVTWFMKASFQSLIPWHKISLISDGETELMRSKMHSQPLWAAKIREGGRSVTQTKDTGVMDTQVPRVKPQGTWIPPLLACKFFFSLRREATDRRYLINPWMFYWTLNLLSTFLSKQSHSDLLFHIQTPYLKEFSLLAFFMQWGKASLSATAVLHQYTDLYGLSLLCPYGGCLQMFLPWDTPGSASTSWTLSWQFLMWHLSIPQGKSVLRKLPSGSNQDEGFGR